MTTTYTPDGLTPPVASYILPQDVIDLVVVETVNNPLVTSANNLAWLLLLSKKIINVLNYGAIGDNTADDGAAILAAIAALDGEGILFLPPGAYRSTVEISWPCGVIVVAAPGRSRLRLDSPTEGAVSITNGASSNTSFVFGLSIVGNQVTTGKLVHLPDDGGKRVTFSQCVLDGTNFRGEVYLDEGDSQLFLQSCVTTSGKISSGQALLSATGSISINGGSATVAPGAIDDLIATGVGQQTEMHGVTLTHLSASASNIAFISGFGTVIAEGCICDTDQASGSTSLVRTFNGTIAQIYGNDFNGHHAAICPAVLQAGFCARGSRIELNHILVVDEATSTTITIPDGYEEVVLNCSAASSPDLTFPAGLFPGQVFRLTYFNAGVNPVQPTIANAPPVTGFAVPTTGAGNTLTATFCWQSYDPALLAYRWVQIGTWGVGAPL